ncbi:EamA family transporter [Paenibacillus sacheonensis]|uniref:EamA family transporter n=1 Tax=Paenibacillus sacheonensis TaxID=742054 RepID=A0A7X4YNU4_9BACL|nr:EamA family transporter [Paenibacillus sacheonensis]MBM7565321.1 drug/metabolite transporter (DMT)-like permease [Paenibacillus sacheonensis]NBC69747.1 EamA family transporter [Paenibacillus sacheonensis]
MWFAAAVGSALLFGLAGWWMKVSQMQGGSSVYLFLGLYFSGAAGFAVNGAVDGTLGAAWTDPRVWAAGLLIGAGSALGNALFMKALAYGPASLTSPLTNMNIILVIALGTFVYDEPLTSAELAGVLLLLIAIVLISIKRSGAKTRLNPRWHLFVSLSILLFALRNGGLKVTDAIGLHGSPVLFAAYLLSFIGFAWIAVRDRSRIHSLGGLQSIAGERSSLAIKPHAASAGLKWGLIAGLFSYAGLQLYAAALQMGQANIAGPIFAANSLVVAAGSILVYRERLQTLQWSAFALMFAGLILVRL